MRVKSIIDVLGCWVVMLTLFIDFMLCNYFKNTLNDK